MTPAIVLVALAAMIVGEVWRMSSPALVRDAPLSKATAVALAMSTPWPASTSGGPSAMVGLLGPVTLVVVAVLVAAAVRRRFTDLLTDLTRMLTVTLVAGVLVRVPWLGDETLLEQARGDEGRPVLVAVLMLAAAIVAVASPLVARSVSRSRRDHGGLRTHLGGELGRHGPLALGTASTATVMALSLDPLGPLGFLLFLVPLLVLQPAVERQRRIRLAQHQTIEALARLTEEAGLTAMGHSARVAALAVPLALEAGMDEADIADLEAAALLHDIGQVGLAQPIPGGATVEVSARDQRRIAGTGAAILARTADLSRLAAIVGDVGVAHHRAEVRLDVSLAARVVRVASAYDDLTGRSTRLAGSGGPLHALERLVRNTPHDYDPVVVEALLRLLERQGRLTAAQAEALRV